MADSTKSARDAYKFLAAKEGQEVTHEQVSAATSGVWSPGTVGNYRSKRWKNLTQTAGTRRFRVNGISLLSEDEFVGLQSQVSDKVAAPQAVVIDQALAAGEGPDVEFKAAFPQTADDLAHEIAALSTSGGGTILLGVNDGGAVVGYTDSKERVEGVGSRVSPPPTMTVDLVEYGGKTICLVRVAPGAEPFYYANSRPYIRQGTLSRPATPDEVKAGFESFFRKDPGRRSLDQGTVHFAENTLTAEVTIGPVDRIQADLSFSPTNDVMGQLVSPTQVRFTRRSTSAPDMIAFRIVERS